MSSRGCINKQFLDAPQVLPGLWRAPDLHLIGLPALVDIGNLFAGYQHSGRPAHVSGLDSVMLRLVEVYFYLHLRHIHLEVLVQFIDTFNR